ncbi:transcriptional regulator [Halalkalibacter wakoensis JCM 9140]|uniref:Transcriptional regulator n=1 Tax=Halalkalibacter wakoensis JCM 9140 TaxID=1236970 RepID=W4Q9K1_9BACI|nr:ROK family transcriptional regulator [Halalkalibacter wakoensis]GAE28064.1 transcriptional regulator [Halalkalibacter wakoensis JCM 9140]
MLKSFIEDELPKHQVFKTVYLLIHDNGPITKTDLLEKTNLKQTTLFRIIERLEKDELIVESGYGESNGGRPPILYSINARLGFIVSLHINRMFTRVSLHNLHFDLIDQVMISMTKLHTPKVVINEIINSIHQFMKTHYFSVDELLGIGVGAIGPLDRERGVILEPEPFAAPGWKDVPIVNELKKHFPVKVTLENGATLAALGEYKGDSSAYKNILCSINSWGIGCGIISNGEVVRAHNGNVGLYGHMVIDINGELCECGKRGCLQAYTSLYAILKDLGSNYLPLEKDINWCRENTNDLIEQLNQDRKITNEAVMRSAYYYGVGLSNIINLFETELAVLSGPLIQLYDGYFNKVKEVTLQHITLNKKVKIVQEKSMQSNASIGAAVSIFSSLFDNEENE